MAEEAAQAAAMRAYEEALREAQHNIQAQQLCGMTDSGMLEQGFRPAVFETGNMLANGLPGNNFDDEQRLQYQQHEHPHVDMLQTLMGIPGAHLDDAATAHQLLQILEQQRQQQATLAAAEVVMHRSSDQQELSGVTEETLDEASGDHHYSHTLEHTSLSDADDFWQRRPERHYLAISHDGKHSVFTIPLEVTAVHGGSRRFAYDFTFPFAGTILEATETVTGFAPQVLLMTSVYDNLFDEDLPGFLCVKTQFWDNGQSDVQVYLRRRSIEGDWIWLESKAVEHVDRAGIPCIILEESLVGDLELAKNVNRTTRITSILVQAVETAWLTEANKPVGGEIQESDLPAQNEDDTDHVQSVIDNYVAQPGVHVPENDGDYQRLLQIARKAATIDPRHCFVFSETYCRFVSNDSVCGGPAGKCSREGHNGADDSVRAPAGAYEKRHDNSSGEYVDGNFHRRITLEEFNDLEKDTQDAEMKSEQEKSEAIGEGRRKSFNPNSMVESVRQGVRLDLGLTRLEPEEVKIMTLVLSGKISVHQIPHLVLCSLQQGSGMKGIAEQFQLESEIKPSLKSTRPGSRSRRPSPPDNPSCTPPPISVVNLSYTYIGNTGVEMLSEMLYANCSTLKTLDISFCSIEEKGLLSLARALVKRKRNKISPLKGIILSGNYISPRAASEIGSAVSTSLGSRPPKFSKRSRGGAVKRTGYDSDNSTETDTDDDDDDDFGARSSRKRKGKSHSPEKDVELDRKGDGLLVLHVANASMTAEAVKRLLKGTGKNCTVRELNLSSNSFGKGGATALVSVLEPRQRSRNKTAAMPFLDRLDMSNNNLGDEGTTQLTRAILKRSETSSLVDLKISSNGIGPVGVETLMNKLLQHNLVSLSLDKNGIGDQGCQLVAASLQSMPSLSRLNLAFNQIGSRGITSLMRSLVTSKSITYLGLSGNILRISGAMALAFTLTQHPRLEELDLDNCCLGQAAQCHIVAGIISNRWVPMKRLKGYAVGPPMVAIGALEPRAANASNEECFRIRKDEQMKNILQWMHTNRSNNSKQQRAGGAETNVGSAGFDTQNSRFLTPDYVSRMNDVHGTPSQSAYLRLLDWLSRIPFDDDELTALQKYFYDADGGEGDRGSDGYINLKLRGDLLAALDGETVDEISDDPLLQSSKLSRSVGLDLDKLFGKEIWNSWEAFQGTVLDSPSSESQVNCIDDTVNEADEKTAVQCENSSCHGAGQVGEANPESMQASGSAQSMSGKDKKGNKVKPRITMFPQFEHQLNELKASATELLEQEEDPVQHEIILTQYAEASLTILRQLRYHCMNSGLDGWRQSGLTRKILIVDDSMITRKLVSRAFEKAGYIVDTAANGAEGVEKLKASLYDIAFMDIEMPVMNGFEATKKLREWEDAMRPGARQPICALTATYVDDFEKSELMKFKEAGLDVMESKPCNIPRLFKVVDDVSPMFSELSISVMQRERSDQSFQSGSSLEHIHL